MSWIFLFLRWETFSRRCNIFSLCPLAVILTWMSIKFRFRWLWNETMCEISHPTAVTITQCLLVSFCCDWRRIIKWGGKKGVPARCHEILWYDSYCTQMQMHFFFASEEVAGDIWRKWEKKRYTFVIILSQVGRRKRQNKVVCLSTQTGQITKIIKKKPKGN